MQGPLCQAKYDPTYGLINWRTRARSISSAGTNVDQYVFEISFDCQAYPNLFIAAFTIAHYPAENRYDSKINSIPAPDDDEPER